MGDDNGNVPSYYDVSILKPPVWGWEIASYFFLGGLSAGAYAIARIADRTGGEKFLPITRAGSWTAFYSFLPCPPLLMHDLGDPKRFHHMLRIWKPTSPMSVGSWTLLGYGGMVTATVLRELVRLPAIDRALLLAHDTAGIPFSLGVMGYPGVLLSCTSNPLWCKNPWLGPLFAASAFSTGAAATQLLMDLRGEDDPPNNVLEKIDTAGHIAQLITYAGFLKHAGPNARPLTRGGMKKHMTIALGAMLASEALKLLPLRGRPKRLVRFASSVATLVGGFALRWAMVYGGHEAAKDPDLARRVTNQLRTPDKIRQHGSPHAPLRRRKPARSTR